MNKHAKLVQKALDAIKEVFSDTSVDEGDVQTSLEGLVEEIQILIDALAQ